MNREHATAALRAGVAVVDITPRRGTPLAGTCTLRPAGAVVDRLRAKALVLEQAGRRVVIITADLLAFDARVVARWRRQWARRHGIGLVLCNASHTHSGPDAYNEFCDYTDGRALAARRRYQQRLDRLLQRVVGAAVRRLQAVSLDYGEGRAAFGVNRRRRWRGAVEHMPNPRGFHDRTVSVFRFSAVSGRPVAVLFSYACHPTTRYADEVAADYPGPAQRFIERRTGAVALFAQGASGDIRPNITRRGSRPLVFRRGTRREVKRLGTALGREVVRALGAGLQPVTPALGWRTAAVRLPLDRIPTARERLAYAPPWVDPRRHRTLARRILARLRRAGRPRGWPMEINLLRVGPDRAILATSHELCNAYVPLLRRLARGTALTVWGYTNGCGAYIPTRKIRREGGYEGDWACTYYGQPAPFHPSVETVVLAGCRRLLDG